MAGTSTWTVEHHTGSAAAFHDRPHPVERSLWWFDVERPTVVLGSTQPASSVDAIAAARLGLDVVRRHSGGGAVLLAPGDVTWVDVIVPAGDPLWQRDVGRAFDWLGDVWVATLTALGVTNAVAHRGAMVRGRWSETVCFAGLGRGEVSADGRKVLGMSQRRTRSGARFQCALLHRWDPAPLVGVLALSAAARERASIELADVAAGVPVDAIASDGRIALEATFLDHLPD